MQPYSELANWDGSLSDIVDSLSPPSPSEASSIAHQTPPIFIPHQSNQQRSDSPVVAHPSTTSSSSHFGPSEALFINAAQESSSVLSPQEREIMADITLDPDDPDGPFISNSAAAAGAWVWAALTSEPAVDDVNDDASSQAIAPKNASATKKPLQQPQQQSRSPFVASASVASSTVSLNSILPVPPAIGVGVASISASVSPSPFAPPPASAPIPGPVSQPVQPSSSSSHSTTKAMSPDARVHPEPLAVSDELDASERPVRGEHVTERASASDDGQARLEGNSTAGQPDSPTLDYPDQPQARSPSLQSPVLPPMDTTNRFSSSRSPDPPRHPSRTPLFLPSPSESATFSRPPSNPPLPEENSDAEPPEVISISSSSKSSSSSPPPPRRSRRSTRIKSKANKQGRQLMAYVLIPPLPPGARKSDYVPMKKMLHMRERAIAKGKARAGDNAGSSALVAALQGAFKNNSSGAGRTETSGARRKRQKVVEPAEVVEVIDDVEEGEEKGEVRNRGSTNLARALSNAFAHNSADPKVSARSTAVVTGRTRQLRRSTHVEISSDSSTSAEVLFSSPPAKHRPPSRARVTSGGIDNSPSRRQRNEKRQPRMPTSPQTKKRRRLVQRDDVDGHAAEEEEIEIADGGPREFPRRASRTKPHSFSKSDPTQPKLSRTSKQRRMSTFSPATISAPMPLPSPSPLPHSSSSLPRDTNIIADLPLTILPTPEATNIMIPARALNHLHASPSPPGPEFETRAYESLQGFHCEEAAVGAHGLLESPTAVAAVKSTSLTTTIDSSPRVNTTGPQKPPMDLGLDVLVPLDTPDGEQELMRAAVVPFDALRISSSTHPEGPMLGFVLSEHDEARRTTSLSADVDTEASSDGVGMELGANTCSDMELMLLASMDPNSGISADSGWIDWDAAGPSTDLATENEYVGDGTIDPSVLGGAGFDASLRGGSPEKSILRSDDYIRSHRSPLFKRAGDKDKHLDDDDIDEGDVMGLLFEGPTDGDFVSRTPSTRSARDAGGKGKDKDSVTMAGADAMRIGIDIDETTRDTRKRRKSWKALADDMDHYEDTDTEADNVVEQPHSPNISNDNISSLLTMTFCHHCRRKTARPKMRCTRIRESTGEQCRKLYCDNCVQKRYPSLTFDEFATSFSCPCCRNFCNCTQCARGRGEAYIPERNGGWRRWAASFPAAAAAATASGPTSPSRKKARQEVLQSAEPERKGTVARAASTTGSFLEATNTTRFVPVQPAAEPLLPSPRSTSPALASALPCSGRLHPATTTSTESMTVLVDKKRRRYVYIGKQHKSWGRLVPVPDPDPDEQIQVRKTDRGGRERKRAVRVRLFAGSEEPLLSSRNHVNKKKRSGRKRKGERNRQQPSASASALPPSQISPFAARSEDGTNRITALHEDSDPDADPDVDVDEGVWPGEYAHAPEHEHVVPDTSGVVTIPAEELERAIGVAIAAGKQYLQWYVVDQSHK